MSPTRLSCIHFTIQVTKTYRKNPLFLTNNLQTSLISIAILLSSQGSLDKNKETQMGKFEQEAKDLLQAIGGKDIVV